MNKGIDSLVFLVQDLGMVSIGRDSLYPVGEYFLEGTDVRVDILI